MNLPSLRRLVERLHASPPRPEAASGAPASSGAPLAPWKKRLFYGGFFALAFLFALHRTFPSDAVQERLILEAAAQGWQLRVSDIAPSGFAGVRARGVGLETRDGLQIPIDEVRASLRLWPLLVGRRSVAFDASIFGGRVQGTAEAAKGSERLAAKASGIDLARAIPLRKASGLDVAGTLGADVDVTLDEKDATKSAGHVDLAVERGAIHGGSVPVPGMAGGLTLPPIDVGRVTARAEIKQGRANVEKLEARSGDLELGTDGLYFVMQPRLEYAPLFGRARVRLTDAFWSKSGTAGFKGLVDMALAQARGRDGSYAFQLYGSLGHPQARPVAQ